MKTSRFPAFLRYFILLVSTTLVLVGFGGSLRSDQEPQNPAEYWLFLSAEAKREYVHGYLSGFYEGKRAACHFYEEQITPYLPHEAVPPEKLPVHICMSTLPEFTASSHYQVYADTITKYFKKYPRDRQAAAATILERMATPPGLSDIDKIHAQLAQR